MGSFSIMMSRKVLIVLIIFSIALGQAQEKQKEKEGVEKEKEAQEQKEKEEVEKEKEAQEEKEKEAQEQKEKELQEQKEKEAQEQKEKEAQEQKEKELEEEKEKEAQEQKEKEAEEQKEKEEQKNAGCCSGDVLVTCDGTNDGSKKDDKKENPCVGFHSWTAQEHIFGCYHKEEKQQGRFWPFWTPTTNEGSTLKQVIITKQEKELWKQDKKGTNAIWFKNGIYHLGDEDSKFKTQAKAYLKNSCLKEGETWSYWADEKWYKNNGVIIKCGC